MSARAAVAAIAERYETAAIGNKIAKALLPPAQRTAVAVKIEKYRLSVARRDVPDDHAFAVGGVEHHLFRLSQPNRRRGRAPALWKILQRALCQVKQCDEAAINNERSNLPDDNLYATSGSLTYLVSAFFAA